MKISLKESIGYNEDFDLEKVLLAMGWLPAQDVTGMISYSCPVLAMYDGRTTVEVAFGDGIDVFEYKTTPENVCAMYDADALGSYDFNSSWNEEISFVNEDTGEEIEFVVYANTGLSPVDALSIVLENYYR